LDTVQITTSFVQYIQNQPEKYAGVGITGHSLGGGLAIISGAQAGALAVALSGPNAMLSRKSFRPSLSVDSLNEYTFVSY
jgi:lipase ATG15